MLILQLNVAMAKNEEKIVAGRPAAWRIAAHKPKAIGGGLMPDCVLATLDSAACCVLSLNDGNQFRSRILADALLLRDKVTDKEI